MGFLCCGKSARQQHLDEVSAERHAAFEDAIFRGDVAVVARELWEDDTVNVERGVQRRYAKVGHKEGSELPSPQQVAVSDAWLEPVVSGVKASLQDGSLELGLELDSGYLHLAAFAGNVDALKQLIDAGAKINRVGFWTFTRHMLQPATTTSPSRSAIPPASPDAVSSPGAAAEPAPPEEVPPTFTKDVQRFKGPARALALACFGAENECVALLDAAARDKKRKPRPRGKKEAVAPSDAAVGAERAVEGAGVTGLAASSDSSERPPAIRAPSAAPDGGQPLPPARDRPNTDDSGPGAHAGDNVGATQPAKAAAGGAQSPKGKTDHGEGYSPFRIRPLELEPLFMDLKREKIKLQHVLYEYGTTFAAREGRPVSSADDRKSVEDEYRRYTELKQALAILETEHGKKERGEENKYDYIIKLAQDAEQSPRA